MNKQIEQQLIKEALMVNSLYTSYNGIDYKIQWLYSEYRNLNGYYLVMI